MRKLTLLASMAVTAIAFSAPAAAQANVFLTEGGNKLAVGAKVTATSSDLTTTTIGGSKLTCANVTLHFEVLANGANHVELEQLGFATTSGCLANGLLPVTITNGGIVANEEGEKLLTINTWGTANATATFISDVYKSPEHTPANLAQSCHFEGVLHMVPKGTSGTDLIEVTKSPLAGTGVGCENANMEGSFTLETSDSKAVNLDFVATG